MQTIPRLATRLSLAASIVFVCTPEVQGEDALPLLWCLIPRLDRPAASYVAYEDVKTLKAAMASATTLCALAVG